MWERGLGPGQHQQRPHQTAPLRGCAIHERPWEGSARPKPWQYRVTAAIPVLDTPDLLEVVIDILRLQTMRPFIIVVDTGSTPEHLSRIESLRSSDVEVHSLRLNGVRHPSDFPAMAMDLAFAVCRTRFLFATHADCFLRKRTLLSEMVELCESTSPVVGYELSPRKHKDWKGMVGHTCTMVDMASMDEIGAGWSLRRLARRYGVEAYHPDPRRPNWPDTELLLNYLLRENGITPHLIGHEENHIRNRDDNIDHCRSLTSGLLYNDTYYQTALGWAEQAMEEARSRIEEWRNETSPRESTGRTAVRNGRAVSEPAEPPSPLASSPEQ
ncbi:glycosyltransferase family 2 protein [Maioricimonas rarisocia]|nr:glycosyltransferase family A protein [Maioricimonas rarisocia]